MSKEEVREKIYKDKNIEKAIKEGVENFLDNTELKKYSLYSGAYAEYEYLNNFVLITTEILEDGYILSDIHIDVNMIVNDYSLNADNKKEIFIALNNNYLIGLNLKFFLKNIEDDIDDIQVRYFSVYGFSNNKK
ncbi:hypothetical protein EPJ80_05590 [Brachyspira aalborgi]|uniref:Uncharacterized protein n=1 Tax=Brachyspira aalborgi TaxID=29522 RepID=A0A5C8CI10_9SPIR|nr:hypothetical protein EPJ80_05590 [Brachyspira aalborgi]